MIYALQLVEVITILGPSTQTLFKTEPLKVAVPPGKDAERWIRQI